MTPTNEAGHGLPELPEGWKIVGITEGHGNGLGDDMTLYTADQMREYARAALALSRWVPADMVLVPVEPTDEMVDAGRVAVMALDCCGPKWTVRKHYEASGADPAGIPDELLDAICPMPKADRAELVYRAMLAAAPAAAGAQGEDVRDSAVFLAFDAITGLCRHLREGGPDPEDLQGLSDGLSEAIEIAGNMLARLTAPQPAAADGGVREVSAAVSERQVWEWMKPIRTVMSTLHAEIGWYADEYTKPAEEALTAIEQALTQQAALSSHRQAGDAFDWIIEITGNPAYPVRITEPAGVNAWEPHASSLGAKFILAVKKLLTAPPPGPDLSKLIEKWRFEQSFRSGGVGATYKRCADELIALVEKGAGNG